SPITPSSRRSTSGSASDDTRAMIFSARCSLVGSNGRITTRELLGLRTIPVRLTSIGGTSGLTPGNSGTSSRVPTLSVLAEGGQGAFQQGHLGERQQKGEGRLGALVPVDPVLLEAVAAAAGDRVVEVLAE